MNNRSISRTYGFTIVELLVVIVVIGILASITIVSYRNISAKAIEASIMSDLDNSSKKLKMHIIEDDTYPLDISELNDCPNPANGHVCLKLSPSSTLGRYYANNSVNPRLFCLTIKSTNTAKSITHNSAPVDGACPPSNLAVTGTTVDSASLSWDLVSGATSYTVQRSDTPDFSSYTNTTVSGGANSATISSLVGGIYYFRINVIESTGTSAWSDVVSASVKTTMTYATPGNYTLTIPSGISFVQVKAWGAQGSDAYAGPGGLGGYSEGNLTIGTQKVLNIHVGSMTGGGVGGAGGEDADGYYFYNGGNGGDASDVRYGGSALGDRKIVAGGGGGGCSGVYKVVGHPGEGPSPGAYGGSGGGNVGGNGQYGAIGGTQTSGASLGLGGAGTDLGLGGGGNGYYGGVGGCGGGGGSGYIGGVLNGVMSSGVWSGNGKVVITY